MAVCIASIHYYKIMGEWWGERWSFVGHSFPFLSHMTIDTQMNQFFFDTKQFAGI